ncbi:MAG: AAA family ATPase [Armatimonadota bacterium]
MKLSQILIKGFKSVDGQQGQTIPLGDLTVMLGANGSGKSNLIAFFKMLNSMTTGSLQQYVGKQGASRLLYYGPKITESISVSLSFDDESAIDTYEFQLSHGLPDRLFVSGEKVACHREDKDRDQEYYLHGGGAEISLGTDERATSEAIFKLLSEIRTYQFHDTSDTAKIKDRGYVDDAAYLRSDGGNLAAFLRMMKTHPDYRTYYERIVRHIQRMMPQFGDFVLSPVPENDKYVRLNWTDSSGQDYLFDPDQISDGSLRFMALATLLMQPPALMPKFIVLDEPELGLHPAAIAQLAAMIISASQKAQILVATQSTRLVDEFTPEVILVVERDIDSRCSVFKKLDAVKLSEWMERYSLSELWEKNVLGGQP